MVRRNKTNSSGGTWTGYGKNWDEAMILQDVDLTGSDRAFLSVELYQDLGWGGLGSASTTGGFILTNVWDDIAMIEVGSEETGWNVISCPTSAQSMEPVTRAVPCGADLTLIAMSKEQQRAILKVYRAIFILSIPIMDGIISLMKDLVHLT